MLQSKDTIHPFKLILTGQGALQTSCEPCGKGKDYRVLVQALKITHTSQDILGRHNQ